MLLKKKKIKFEAAVKKAQKDPKFIKEIDRFIKASTKIHKL
tara:strand:+ start:1202 stop:1324 length:123 start_codon:yes stop_codon:yes gene_type:complete